MICDILVKMARIYKIKALAARFIIRLFNFMRFNRPSCLCAVKLIFNLPTSLFNLYDLHEALIWIWAYFCSFFSVGGPRFEALDCEF
jgi:hypothetical protein